ncbi:cysteine desulfurase [Lachnospiraceae bacterium KM106-2]|nr:cysteine desulfurase [Lachnospiraceae bacterium KM106-2]
MRKNSPWRKCFVGTNTTIETACGIQKRIFFNNGATPLILKKVSQTANQLFPCFTYLNEHNCNSEFITEQYNAVREKAAEFVHADTKKDVVLFTRTATEGLNLVAYLYQQLVPDGIIFSTCLEHMANYLSFQQRMNTKLIPLMPNGEIDLSQYAYMLETYKGQVKLVTVTGASNLTGYVPPYYEMARMAHEYGAHIMVDAVQTVQHMPFSMLSYEDPCHIDFTAFTAHKCYTGLAGAAIIGPKEFFDAKVYPLTFGAGVNAFANMSQVILADTPDRYECGYPDITGITCFGTAMDFLMDCGMDGIEEYEYELRQYLLEGLLDINGVIVYGPISGKRAIPYVAFGMEGINYKELAQKLGYQYGIAVSAGVAGADIYTQWLLGLTDEQTYQLYQKGETYGTVRVSLGMFNSKIEVDRLLYALYEIGKNECCRH